jgi:hypothetical protein
MTTAAPESVRDTLSFTRLLEVFDATNGWCYRESAAIWDALLTAQEERQVGGNMLEIGVWHGKTAALLAAHARPPSEMCFFIDKFLNEDEVRATLLKVRPTLESDLQLVRLDSRQIPGTPMLIEGHRQFRWIHIDGEHTGGAVLGDLAVANLLLSERGVVCVDDFMSWMYPQITEAVFRYQRDHPEQLALFLCGFNKAYLARTHFVHDYLELCHEKLVTELETRGFPSTLAKTTWPAEMNCFGIGGRYEGFRHRGPDWAPGSIRL